MARERSPSSYGGDDDELKTSHARQDGSIPLGNDDTLAVPECRCGRFEYIRWPVRGTKNDIVFRRKIVKNFELSCAFEFELKNVVFGIFNKSKYTYHLFIFYDKI